MDYITTIKTALLIFPFLALLFTIPFILSQYHRYGSINKFRTIIIYSFILYIFILYFLVILPLPKIEDVVYKENMIRLIPFGFINDFIKESPFILNNPKTYIATLKHPSFYTVSFNVLMTIPFGMYLRYYFKYNLKKTLLFSFLLSMFFELTQITGLYYIYPYQYRIFDVDDLITNTLGGVIGYLFIGLFIKYLPTRDNIDERSRKAGEIVSGLRRLTLFFLDLFIIIFLTMFFKNNYIKLSIFIIYYIIIPINLNGQTIGGKFINVRLEFKKYKNFNLILRVIFITIYCLFPIILINLKVNSLLKIFMLLLDLIFYLENIYKILTKKEIFYDKLFKVTYKSTINEKGVCDEEDNN